MLQKYQAPNFERHKNPQLHTPKAIAAQPPAIWNLGFAIGWLIFFCCLALGIWITIRAFFARSLYL